MGWVSARAFRALRQRNFRLFVVGQVLSVSGTWAQRVAQGWLAYRLTHSTFYLGLVTFAGSAPAFLLTPIAGVIADRTSRRRMLVWLQALLMAQAAVLAAFTFAGSITPRWLLLLSLAQGSLAAFENPTRQSFYTEMAGSDALASAIALNATLMNVARILGPAVAGVVVAAAGEGVCFAANAASFLAVIVALLMMKVPAGVHPADRARGWELLREGFAFVRGVPVLRAMLLNFGLWNLAGSSYLTLLPTFTAESLGNGPAALGWLISASGVGAIVSSLVLASRADTAGLPGASFAASGVSGGALIVLGFSRSFAISLLLLLLVGAGYSFTLASTQTMMQVRVKEAMRGRVMSFYSLVFLGVPPIGALVAGIVAEKLHAGGAISAGGTACLAGAILCARASQDRG
ncbi:MAG TPA: MFS transporter [Bryobacteraceae bacterium]|nr:MFS transporter [Bryobacteraceae bacterium]